MNRERAKSISAVKAAAITPSLTTPLTAAFTKNGLIGELLHLDIARHGLEMLAMAAFTLPQLRALMRCHS